VHWADGPNTLPMATSVWLLFPRIRISPVLQACFAHAKLSEQKLLWSSGTMLSFEKTEWRKMIARDDIDAVDILYAQIHACWDRYCPQQKQGKDSLRKTTRPDRGRSGKLCSMRRKSWSKKIRLVTKLSDEYPRLTFGPRNIVGFRENWVRFHYRAKLPFQDWRSVQICPQGGDGLWSWMWRPSRVRGDRWLFSALHWYGRCGLMWDQKNVSLLWPETFIKERVPHGLTGAVQKVGDRLIACIFHCHFWKNGSLWAFWSYPLTREGTKALYYIWQINGENCTPSRWDLHDFDFVWNILITSDEGIVQEAGALDFTSQMWSSVYWSAGGFPALPIGYEAIQFIHSSSRTSSIKLGGTGETLPSKRSEMLFETQGKLWKKAVINSQILIRAWKEYRWLSIG